MNKIVRVSIIGVIILVSFIVGYILSGNLDYPVYAKGDSVVTSEKPDVFIKYKEEESIIDSESRWIAKALVGIDENNPDDKRTYATCIVLRCLSKKYPNTIEEVVNQPGQWILYDKDNIVTSVNYDIGREVVEMMHIGILPVSDEFTYIEWSKERVILKNNYLNSTLGWRWGEGVFKYD